MARMPPDGASEILAQAEPDDAAIPYWSSSIVPSSSTYSIAMREAR